MNADLSDNFLIFCWQCVTTLWPIGAYWVVMMSVASRWWPFSQPENGVLYYIVGFVDFVIKMAMAVGGAWLLVWYYCQFDFSSWQ